MGHPVAIYSLARASGIRKDQILCRGQSDVPQGTQYAEEEGAFARQVKVLWIQ